jgi:hypothetical protein
MLRNAPAVLAILLVLGSSGLSANAFARSGGYVAGAVGFRGNNSGGGFGGTPGDSYDGYGNRASGLRGEFRGYGSHDVWGHWGARPRTMWQSYSRSMAAASVRVCVGSGSCWA